MIKQLLLALVLAGVTVMVHVIGTVHVVLPAVGRFYNKPSEASSATR